MVVTWVVEIAELDATEVDSEWRGVLASLLRLERPRCMNEPASEVTLALLYDVVSEAEGREDAVDWWRCSVAKDVI